jgi:hypothetical protein
MPAVLVSELCNKRHEIIFLLCSIGTMSWSDLTAFTKEPVSQTLLFNCHSVTWCHVSMPRNSFMNFHSITSVYFFELWNKCFTKDVQHSSDKAVSSITTWILNLGNRWHRIVSFIYTVSLLKKETSLDGGLGGLQSVVTMAKFKHIFIMCIYLPEH